MWPLFVVLGILILLGAGFLIRSEWERNHPVTVEYEVASPLIPKESEGFSFLYLADLHGKIFPKENEALLKLFQETQYDLALIGGDMMTKFKTADRDRKALRSLLGGIREGVPVFYAPGNHEQRMLSRKDRSPDWESRFREILSAYGVRFLQDETVHFPVEGGEILLSAADLPGTFYRAGAKRALPEDFLQKKLGKKADRFTILLLHSPLYLEEAAEWGADLTLMGHFHGGTIRLLGRGLMTPQYQFFYPRCQGRFMIGEKCGIVSAGLGTHSVNIRLFDRPEVVRIVLKHAEKVS